MWYNIFYLAVNIYDNSFEIKEKNRIKLTELYQPHIKYIQIFIFFSEQNIFLIIDILQNNQLKMGIQRKVFVEKALRYVNMLILCC